MPRTNDRLLEIQQLLISANARVESGNVTKKAYDNLEMGLDFNSNAEGLVCDEALFSVVNFAKIWRTVWAHDELQSSVVQRELKCFLAACEQVGIKKVVPGGTGRLSRACFELGHDPLRLTMQLLHLAQVAASRECRWCLKFTL